MGSVTVVGQQGYGSTGGVGGGASGTVTAESISNATAAGRAVLKAADAAAQRTALGLGTAATQASTAFVQSSDLGVTVATLVGGKLASSQIPGSVDQIDEAANFAALPATGAVEKMYVTLDTNKTYRWSGSAYVEISPSPGSTDVVPEGATNKYFTSARVLATTLAGYVASAVSAIAATDTISSAMAKIGGFIALFAGGTSGQVLKKNSSTAFDFGWGADASGGGGSAIGAGRTIAESGALQGSDVNTIATADTSGGAITMTLNTGVLTTVGQVIYVQRSGTNGFSFVSGTATVRNPLGIDVANLDVIGLLCTAPDVGLVIGEDLDTARKNVANAWTKAQASTPVTLTDAATVAIDATASNKFILNMTDAVGASRELGNPTGMMHGQSITIRLDQGGTGNKGLTYASMWRPQNKTTPTLSTAAGSHDVLTGVYWADLNEVHYSFGGNF